MHQPSWRSVRQSCALEATPSAAQGTGRAVHDTGVHRLPGGALPARRGLHERAQPARAAGRPGCGCEQALPEVPGAGPHQALPPGAPAAAIRAEVRPAFLSIPSPGGLLPYPAPAPAPAREGRGAALTILWTTAHLPAAAGVELMPITSPCC